jgi:hypothetical protein
MPGQHKKRPSCLANIQKVRFWFSHLQIAFEMLNIAVLLHARYGCHFSWFRLLITGYIMGDMESNKKALDPREVKKGFLW